jgi:hypothetical protein
MTTRYCVVILISPPRKELKMTRILSEIDNANAEFRPSFWKKQFAVGHTPGQRVFDVVFGIVAPLACFYADPVVFKSGKFFYVGHPMYAHYQLFAYLLSAIAIAVFLTWLCFENHFGAYCPLISGVFMAGAAFSLIIGIIILPYSLLGLMFVIGIAGFTPFLTAFVYLRNSIKAFRRSSHNDMALIAGAVLGVLIAIGLPALITYQVDKAISQAVDELLKGDGAYAQNTIDRVRWMPLVPEGSFEPIVVAYERASDPGKKEALKKYYRDSTGEDIELRLSVLSD